MVRFDVHTPFNVPAETLKGVYVPAETLMEASVSMQTLKELKRTDSGMITESSGRNLLLLIQTVVVLSASAFRGSVSKGGSTEPEETIPSMSFQRH